MISSKSRRATVAATALVIAFSSVLLASDMARADNDPVDVVVTDKGCEPIALTVAAGKTMFKIKNTSKRAIEWEILQGYMVVEERENIIPGFVQNLTATLEPGDYGMTCGLLSNPKGSLKVTASTAPQK